MCAFRSPSLRYVSGSPIRTVSQSSHALEHVWLSSTLSIVTRTDTSLRRHAQKPTRIQNVTVNRCSQAELLAALAAGWAAVDACADTPTPVDDACADAPTPVADDCAEAAPPPPTPPPQTTPPQPSPDDVTALGTDGVERYEHAGSPPDQSPLGSCPVYYPGKSTSPEDEDAGDAARIREDAGDAAAAQLTTVQPREPPAASAQAQVTPVTPPPATVRSRQLVARRGALGEARRQRPCAFSLTRIYGTFPVSDVDDREFRRTRARSRGISKHTSIVLAQTPVSTLVQNPTRTQAVVSCLVCARLCEGGNDRHFEWSVPLGPGGRAPASVVDESRSEIPLSDLETRSIDDRRSRSFSKTSIVPESERPETSLRDAVSKLAHRVPVRRALRQDAAPDALARGAVCVRKPAQRVT